MINLQTKYQSNSMISHHPLLISTPPEPPFKIENHPSSPNIIRIFSNSDKEW